jgi:hypothetical protein
MPQENCYCMLLLPTGLFPLLRAAPAYDFRSPPVRQIDCLSARMFM